MRRKLILAFTLLFAFVMLTANAGLTEAATSRVAIISKLTGTVEVQKSGGKKTLKGFKNMSLNEGDIVSTGSKSSVELKFSNGTSTDDTLVLESDTTVTFSKLSSKNGTITKVKMKSGKAWVDVKSISSDSDDFQLETPTAIMGVRGTNFFIGIDPNTGKSVLGMFAGVVQLQTGEDNFRNTQFVFPTQLLYTSPTEGELIGLMSNDSLEQMLQLTSPDTMQAILNNLQKVQQENADMLEQYRDSMNNNSDLPASIQAALQNEQLRTNMERIVAALLKEAVEKNLITQREKEDKLQELFGELADKQEDTFVGTEGNNEYDFILNQKTQQMLELLNQSDKIADRKAALENQLAEQKKKLEEEKQKREQQAMENYLNTLNDEQKNKFLQDRDRVSGSTPTPTNRPTPTITPAPTNTPEPTPTSTPSWNEVAEPFIVEQQSNGSVALSYTKLTEEKRFALNNAINAEAGMHVEFKGANEQFQITSVSVNGEPLSSEQGRYIWYLSSTTEFNITIGMSHSSYGETSFTLLGSVDYNDDVATAPIIWQQPVSQTVNVGEDAILSVTAESLDGGTLSYQWYRNSVNSNYGGQLISGANGASYAVPTGAASTGYYYVEVTNIKNSTNGPLEASMFSNAVQVIVNPIVDAATPSINTQPTSVEADQGASATLTVAAAITDNGTLSYQWYSNTTSSNSGGTMIANATSATYTAPTDAAGTSYYYIVVTNTNNNVNGVQTASTTSQSAQVTVNPLVHAAAPVIMTNPSDRVVNMGLNATLSVEVLQAGDGGTLSFQWYSNTSDSNNGGTAINGATGQTYSVPTNAAGTSYYYVVVTNTNNSVNGVKTATADSQAAQVTVNPFIAVHSNWGEETELDYSYEEASQAYVLNEQINYSSSAELLVIKPPSSSYTITGVEITDQYGGPYPLMDYNGSFQGMMPSGPFTAVISMTGAANEDLQFTLQGVSNYEQPPGWEDYEPPFMLEILSNQVSTPLGYTSTGEYLSYTADENVYVSQGDRLEIFSADSDFTITDVRVNYESAPKDGDKHSWGLEAGWRLLNIEIDVTHNVQQSGLGSATYYLTVTTRTIPQGWETIEKPVVLTLTNEQSQESIPINYYHAPYGYSTLVVEKPVVVTDPSRINFDVAGQDYHIQSVSIGSEEMEGHDEYYWSLQLEFQFLNVTIELMHDQYGPQTLYTEIIVLPDPEIMPVFFNIGHPETDLSEYYNHYYSSDPDYDGVYTRILQLGQIMISQQGMPQDMYIEPIANPIMRLEYEQDGQWVEFSPDYEGMYFIRLNDFTTITFRMTIWNEELAEEQVYLINGMVFPYGGV